MITANRSPAGARREADGDGGHQRGACSRPHVSRHRQAREQYMSKQQLEHFR